MILAVLFLGCGGDEAGAAKIKPAPPQDSAAPVEASEQREVIQVQKQQVLQAKKETQCIKVYLMDMKMQQQGVKPEWPQPSLDSYMEGGCQQMLRE